MPSDQGPTDPRRTERVAEGRADLDEDGLGSVHEQRPASDYYDDEPYDDYDDGPRLLARRLIQGGVALLAVGLFLGVVWYAYTWGSRSAATGDVPVVAAPDGAEKVEPDDPGGMEVPHQDKLLLNRDGEDVDGGTERLLPPPEEPQPPERTAQDGADTSGQGQGTVPPAAEDEGEQVSELPEMTVPDQDATGTAQDRSGAGTAPSADAPEQPDGAAAADAGEPTPRTPERKPGGDRARASEPDGTAGGGTRSAAADPAETPGDTSADTRKQPDAAPAEGRYAVQLAAFQSEQAARRAWSGYQERFPDLLRGQRLLLENAKVDGTTYWRVRAGPFAQRSSAQSLCERFEAQDQSCLPVTR